MPSWRERAAAGALALVAAACQGTIGEVDATPDAAPAIDCEASVLRYGNFGEPFLLDWCRGCHSATVPMDMRQGAPLDVNFDTFEEVDRFAERIAVRAGPASPTMPPAGGPSGEERELLAEWLACGHP